MVFRAGGAGGYTRAGRRGLADFSAGAFHGHGGAAGLVAGAEDDEDLEAGAGAGLGEAEAGDIARWGV